MGDRANVLVKETRTGPGVYLYTHWRGTELPTTVQTALKKDWRHDDCSYLTRIIFDTMTEGCQGEETGFGISAFAPDGEGRVIQIIVAEQKVIIGGEEYSFKKFMGLENPQWR